MKKEPHSPASCVISVFLVYDAVRGSTFAVQASVAAAKRRAFAAEAFVAKD